ncbi:hypothetical protein GYA49_03270 [Candidatus Beckwithbacteria bacterium]|nr:hypothetical protein [Candidatus Beckwithbacteria bacterium]
MKTLIVYYSRTGNTAKIAKELAKNLKADLEIVYDTKNRRGPVRWFLAGGDGMGKKITAIKTPKYDPSKYDRVIIGTPIWVNATPAIRTYIQQNVKGLKKVAFFCTMGGINSEGVFADLQAETGKKPIATLAIRGKDVKAKNYSNALQEFVHKLK